MEDRYSGPINRRQRIYTGRKYTGISIIYVYYSMYNICAVVHTTNSCSSSVLLYYCSSSVTAYCILYTVYCVSSDSSVRCMQLAYTHYCIYYTYIRLYMYMYIQDPEAEVAKKAAQLDEMRQKIVRGYIDGGGVGGHNSDEDDYNLDSDD